MVATQPNDPSNAQSGPKVEDDNEKKRRGRECCKRVLKFLFSHIGLCGMVIAYSVAGGFIFKHLEQTNEKEECLKQQLEYEPAENDTMNKLWEISRTFRYVKTYDLALNIL